MKNPKFEAIIANAGFVNLIYFHTVKVNLLQTADVSTVDAGTILHYEVVM